MCRRGRCLPSWSVGKTVQPCASGCSAIQLMVCGHSRRNNRSRQICTPQRHATGTEKSLCRQGATQGVAPTLLSCPPGFAVCTCPNSTCRRPVRPTCLNPRSPGRGPESCSRVAGIAFRQGHAFRRAAERSQALDRREFRQGKSLRPTWHFMPCGMRK